MTDSEKSGQAHVAHRREWVMATGNLGKVVELQSLFNVLDVTLRLQSELDVTPAEETGSTFVENAILKARAASQQTGLPALADDSGLEVDALNGRPVFAQHGTGRTVAMPPATAETTSDF